MSKKFVVVAEARTDMGKGASRRLRRTTDLVPGILYGGGEAPAMITVSQKDLKKSLEDEAFAFSILNLQISGKSEQAVIKDLQRHPYKPRILHVDFLRITGKESITMHVPLHFKGEDIAPGVKDDGGIVSHLMTDVEIKCLPKDLPEFIEVDLSKLELNSTLHLSDIALPKGVSLTMNVHDEAHNLPIVSIHLPRRGVEEEEAPPVSAEVPTLAQEKKEAEE